MAKGTAWLRRAVEFLASVTGKMGALSARELALEHRLVELNQERVAFMAAYTPDKGFDSAAIERIEGELRRVEMELTALRAAKEITPDHDAAEAVAMIEGVRTEASEVLAKKADEANAARDAITKAKAAYLKALRDHNGIVRESENIRGDYNGAITELAKSVASEIRRLRAEWQTFDRQIFEMAADGTVHGINPNQPRIDAVTADLDELRRRINTLEAQVAPINSSVRDIDAFFQSGTGNPYLVEESEVRRAGRGEG
jgi:hypothetical protein